MRQFSIKNDEAARLLEQVTTVTGEGKTEAIIHALELYRDKLTSGPELAARLDSLRRNVHGAIKQKYLGRAPTRAEIETELGLP
jgi:hypothetical protein